VTVEWLIRSSVFECRLHRAQEQRETKRKREEARENNPTQSDNNSGSGTSGEEVRCLCSRDQQHNPAACERVLIGVFPIPQLKSHRAKTSQNSKRKSPWTVQTMQASFLVCEEGWLWPRCLLLVPGSPDPDKIRKHVLKALGGPVHVGVNFYSCGEGLARLSCVFYSAVELVISPARVNKKESTGRCTPRLTARVVIHGRQ
jgi:hypothetical protein